MTLYRTLAFVAALAAASSAMAQPEKGPGRGPLPPDDRRLPVEPEPPRQRLPIDVCGPGGCFPRICFDLTCFPRAPLPQETREN